MVHCNACGLDKPPLEFTKSQRKKIAAERRCKDCVKKSFSKVRCPICRESKPRSAFSKSQLRKVRRRGRGVAAKCKECIARMRVPSALDADESPSPSPPDQKPPPAAAAPPPEEVVEIPPLPPFDGIFKCPICERIVSGYDVLEPHFERCWRIQEQFMHETAKLTVKAQIKQMKEAWPELEREIVRKREEELALIAKQREDLDTYGKDCIACSVRKYKGDVEEMGCCHKDVCHDCIRSYIDGRLLAKRVSSLVCRNPDCTVEIAHGVFQKVLSDDKVDELEEAQVQDFMRQNPDQFVFCPKCGHGFERISQGRSSVRARLMLKSREEKIKAKKEVLWAQAVKKAKSRGHHKPRRRRMATPQVSPVLSPRTPDIHHEQYRYLCRICRTEFCALCKTTPYHGGFTCASFKRHLAMARCRYCDTVIDGRSPLDAPLKGEDKVCRKDECVKKKEVACQKVHHECGHPCGGVKGETECLKCLMCVPEAEEGDPPPGEEFCNICFVEALNSAPCVALKCRHVFHFACLREKLAKRWPTPDMFVTNICLTDFLARRSNSNPSTWNFVACPLCQVSLDGTETGLQEDLKPLLELRQHVREMGMKRMKFSGMLNHKDLTTPSSRFYQKPEVFAEARLAYYQCFECKRPYFGGMKSCEEAAQEGAQQRQFKKEELVCGDCAAKKLKIDAECPIHGKEVVQYVLLLFLANTVRSPDGNVAIVAQSRYGFVSERRNNWQARQKTPIDELPKCKGPGECPSGGNHDGNGVERALGCAVCRQKLEF